MPSLFIKEYQPLREVGSEEERNSRNVYCRNDRSHRFLLRGLVVVLAISVLTNVFWIYREQQTQSDDIYKSKYAQLSRHLPLPFTIEGHENTLPDEEWKFPNTDTGMVALTDEYVAEMRLPQAQRFPWDNSKGIYFLHGHHNLHCLKMVRESILEYRNHSLQSQHYLHIDHCLRVLREDILCNADDTPRYTGGHYKQPGSGHGQVRLCRDWAQLDEWAQNRSACFQTPKTFF